VTRETTRPSGWPPPAETSFGGDRLALQPLAEEVARRHLERHPDDVERYGELAYEWAVHDMQHVLAWAFGESSGFVDLGQQVAWLARVLAARDYPLGNLADCLQEAAGVVAERVAGAEAIAARLREVAGAVGA
jgi:hypothetical protein